MTLVTNFLQSPVSYDFDELGQSCSENQELYDHQNLYDIYLKLFYFMILMSVSDILIDVSDRFVTNVIKPRAKPSKTIGWSLQT